MIRPARRRPERNLALYARPGYRETGRRIEDGFARVYLVKTLA